MDSLMKELETLKAEKLETEEARKTTEEQIESTRKDHEEKVFCLFLFMRMEIFFFYIRPSPGRKKSLVYVL